MLYNLKTTILNESCGRSLYLQTHSLFYFMETIETLIDLATTIEKQIIAESQKDIEPVEKLIRANAKNEVLIEIYKFINKEK